MPRGTHNAKTFQYVYDEQGIPQSHFPRRCFRCHQKILGYGFFTLYGYIEETNARGETIRRYASGEPVHHRCPPCGAAMREVAHDPALFGESAYALTTLFISEGITRNLKNGRYAARVDKKRLGTYPTIEQAEHARQEYIRAQKRSRKHAHK